MIRVVHMLIRVVHMLNRVVRNVIRVMHKVNRVDRLRRVFGQKIVCIFGKESLWGQKESLGGQCDHPMSQERFLMPDFCFFLSE